MVQTYFKIQFNYILFTHGGKKEKPKAKKVIYYGVTKCTIHILVVKQSVLLLESFTGLQLKRMMSRIWSNECHFNVCENSGSTKEKAITVKSTAQTVCRKDYASHFLSIWGMNVLWQQRDIKHSSQSSPTLRTVYYIQVSYVDFIFSC